MAIPQKDIKMLWGRAANRCAICRTVLSHVKEEKDGALPVGEQAHIVSEENGGPRGHSSLTLEERNSYYNLVLLCPTHHTLIDKDIGSYPVERLHLIKSKHETWVEQRLGCKTGVEDEFYGLADFLTFIELIRPLIHWLHRSVPSQQSQDFFEALHTFWSYRNIATDHLDPKLTRGVEHLLRPLASRQPSLSEDKYYNESKLFIGYSLLSDYFNSKNITMAGIERNDTVDEIICQLTVEFENALNKTLYLNDDEITIIRHVLHINNYYENHIRNNEYVQVPESLVRQLLSFLKEFLSDHFKITYPDELDARSLDRIEQACKGTLFRSSF